MLDGAELNFIGPRAAKCPRAERISICATTFSTTADSNKSTERMFLHRRVSNFNLVGNYAKSGPATPSGSMLFGLDGVIFMNDNVYPGQSIMSVYSTPTYLTQPHAFPSVTTTSAAQAYDDVLNLAGSWPRDAMTTRTVSEARAGDGSLGKLDDPLNTSTGPAPPADADSDGMPDSWEQSHGLNPNNASDAAQLHSSGYANVELLEQIADQLIRQTRPLPPTGLTVS